MSDNLARRLVVTGHDDRGRSRVALDTIVRGEAMPGQGGLECSVIWGSDDKMQYPDNGAKPPYTDFFPPLDGYRLIECFLPPQHAPAVGPSVEDGQTAALDDAAPGVARRMIVGARPGMHRTPTVDLIVVLSGRCVLQLDNEDVTLKAGDMLVESGTVHAWTNPFPEPCRFLCAVIGAKNELCE